MTGYFSFRRGKAHRPGAAAMPAHPGGDVMPRLPPPRALEQASRCYREVAVETEVPVCLQLEPAVGRNAEVAQDGEVSCGCGIVDQTAGRRLFRAQIFEGQSTQASQPGVRVTPEQESGGIQG